MDETKLPHTDDGKLAHLIEECSEVVRELADITHAVCKLRRFGTPARDPVTGIVYDNAGAIRAAFVRLDAELVDLNTAIAAVRAILPPPYP